MMYEDELLDRLMAAEQRADDAWLDVEEAQDIAERFEATASYWRDQLREARVAARRKNAAS